MPFQKFFVLKMLQKSKLFASLPFGILNIFMLNLTIICLFPKTITLLIVLRINNDHYFFTMFFGYICEVFHTYVEVQYDLWFSLYFLCYMQ